MNIWDVSDEYQLHDAIGAGPTSITADLGILAPPIESGQGAMCEAPKEGGKG